MIKKILLLTSLLCILFGLSSCSKSENEPDLRASWVGTSWEYQEAGNFIHLAFKSTDVLRLERRLSGRESQASYEGSYRATATTLSTEEKTSGLNQLSDPLTFNATLTKQGLELTFTRYPNQTFVLSKVN